MTRVYIASAHPAADMARDMESALQAIGYDVVSTWYHLPVGYEDCEFKAIKDCVEIYGSDILVALAEEGSGGGFHNEVGYAMGVGKPVIIVGDSVGMLGYHPAVEHLDFHTCINLMIQLNDPVRLSEWTQAFRRTMLQKQMARRCQCGRLFLIAVNAELDTCPVCHSTLKS